MAALDLVLLLFAVVAFGLAAAQVRARVNLIGAGLMLVTLVSVIHAFEAVH